MRNILKSLAVAVAALAGLVGSNVASAGGVTFLIGSDVVNFHGDASYINPLVDQMANFGGKKLLFVGSGTGINYTNGNVTITYEDAATWNATPDLTGYSGVFFDATGGCCSDAGPTLTAAATISAFVAGGGSLGVGDYQGDTFWDSILGFVGLPGVTDGRVTDPFLCLDPGVSTPGGLAFGFNPSYNEGCFVHQTYDPAFWTAKGYFALQTAPGHSGDFVTMATGFADPAGVPEPGSLALVGLALAAGAAGLKRRKA